jgi:hypothetical protein
MTVRGLRTHSALQLLLLFNKFRTVDPSRHQFQGKVVTKCPHITEPRVVKQNSSSKHAPGFERLQNYGRSILLRIKGKEN